MKIIIDDVIMSRVKRTDKRILSECLTYTYEKYKFDPYKGKSIKVKKEKMVINSKGEFLTGYIPRVRNFLAEQKIEFSISDNSEKLKPNNPPKIKGKTPRPDQLNLLESALENQRGVIISPTGSGKTLLAGLIISSFKNKKVLFLCDKKSLLRQAENDFKEYGLKNISIVGEKGNKVIKDISGDIVVSTMQSFIKLDIIKISDLFDIVIIDECHGIAETFKEILCNLLAPIRIGLTATYPSTPARQMNIEGVLGPIIGEFAEEEAVEKGIIATTKVVIRKTDLDHDIRELKGFKNAYHDGIVIHHGYNRQVMKEVKYWNDKGMSVLVFFVEKEHGRLLKKIGDEMGIDCDLVYGDTKSDSREISKQNLKDKKLKCVLASVVWKQGINIPSLNVIINASGGKSDIAIRQAKGRGGRTTEDKKEMIFVDFFNPSHTSFIAHFGYRISLFFELGWMGND